MVAARPIIIDCDPGQDDAVKARDKALSAMKTVAMKYVVAGKTYDCSSQVCPTAMSAGKVEFVVNDSKTNCKIKARVLMAQAQYEAARGIATKLARL